jgi:hypothetical protein
MPIRRGVVASSITSLPTVTINAVTNFNQDRATFNATVSANYQSTTVKFQYNTTNNFASYTEVTATGSPVTGQSVAVYFNATGLSVGTTYYVRAVISNGIGTVTTSSVSFTTWSLKLFSRTVSGSQTQAIPTITPTGGSAVIPSIYQLFMFGGGGGGSAGGGGGGGFIFPNSSNVSIPVAFNNTSNLTLTINVGVGGAAGDYSGGANLDGGPGGSTTIEASGSFTIMTASGGAGGRGNLNIPSNGGASGSGTNGSNGGGTGSSSQTGSGKDTVYYSAAGGGGGCLSAGANGEATGNGRGGDGGLGGVDPSGNGLIGGSGGGGVGTVSFGQGNRILFGGNTGVHGCGGSTPAGQVGIAGSAGGCTFKYYGP